MWDEDEKRRIILYNICQEGHAMNVRRLLKDNTEYLELYCPTCEDESDALRRSD